MKIKKSKKILVPKTFRRDSQKWKKFGIFSILRIERLHIFLQMQKFIGIYQTFIELESNTEEKKLIIPSKSVFSISGKFLFWYLKQLLSNLTIDFCINWPLIVQAPKFSSKEKLFFVIYFCELSRRIFLDKLNFFSKEKFNFFYRMNLLIVFGVQKQIPLLKNLNNSLRNKNNSRDF